MARRAAAEREAQLERCDLCSEPIPPEHRHLLDLSSHELMCACRACAVLFDRSAAGGRHYRLVPRRLLALEGFRLDDVAWAALGVPVGMAFFCREGSSGNVVARYPGPAGALASFPPADAWERVAGDNPVLASLEDDVEALLVDRAHGHRRYFLVPVDEAFRLVALIRTSWRGLTGGQEVRQAMDGFFDDLQRRAKTARGGGEEG
jgi:hypothetical protein